MARARGRLLVLLVVLFCIASSPALATATPFPAEGGELFRTSKEDAKAKKDAAKEEKDQRKREAEFRKCQAKGSCVPLSIPVDATYDAENCHFSARFTRFPVAGFYTAALLQGGIVVNAASAPVEPGGEATWGATIERNLNTTFQVQVILGDLIVAQSDVIPCSPV